MPCEHGTPNNGLLSYCSPARTRVRKRRGRALGKESMKRGILVAIASFALFWLAMEIPFMGPARRARKRIYTANHPVLLSDCRRLISNRGSFTNESDLVRVYENSVVLERGSDRIPASIAELKPGWVEIRTNVVVIPVLGGHPHQRRGVRAFAEDAAQAGTDRLIDGLWFWGGYETAQNVAQPPPERDK